MINLSLRLGDQIVSVADATVEEGENVTLHFDPTKMMPIFMPTEDFKIAMQAVGLDQVLTQEPEHQGRKWHNYIRRAGVPLGKFITLLTQSEGFRAEGGIAVGYVEPSQPDTTEQPDTAEATEEKEPQKGKGKVKAKP